MSVIKKIFSGDFFIYTSPSFFRFFFTFIVIVPVTTYFLDPEDFGLFALMIGLTLPIQAIGASGSRWIIGGNFFWTQDNNDRNVLIFNTLFFEFLIRSIVVLFYFFLSNLILTSVLDNVTEFHKNLFYILLLSIWLSSLWPTISFVFVVQKKPKVFSFISILQILINGLVSILCLTIFNLGVEALFLALLITNLISLLFELFFIKDFIVARLSFNWIKKICKAFAISIPGSLSETLMFLSERVLIQKFIGAYALGIYNHSQLYQSVLKSLTGSLSNTVTPETFEIFSTKRFRESKISDNLTDAFAVWLFFLFFVGISFVFFGDEVISFLTHDKFTEAAKYLPIWILLILSITYGIIYSQFLASQKKINFLMVSQLIFSLLGILLMILFIDDYGIMVVPSAILFTSILVHSSRRTYCKKLGFSAESEIIYPVIALIIIFTFTIDIFFKPSLIIESVLFLITFVSFSIWFKIVEKLKILMSYNKD